MLTSAQGGTQTEPETLASYSCSHQGCLLTFPTTKQLECHNFRAHKLKKAFFCGNCNKNCSSREDLMEHLKIHMPSNLPQKQLPSGVFKCISAGCERTSSSIDDLQKHLLEHRSDDGDDSVHQCKHCGKLVKNLFYFNNHVKLHSLKMPGHLNCIHFGCNRVFKFSSALRKHVGKHKKFMCVKCGMCCPSGALLQQHMSKHAKPAVKS